MTKKQALLVVLALVASCFLSGCDELGSPTDVLGTAFRAVSKNDLKLLSRTMSGDAAASYANPAGLAELSRLVAGKKVSVGQLELTSRTRDNRGWTITREFAATVVGRAASAPRETPAVLLHAGVHCDVSYFYKGRDFPSPYEPTPDYDCVDGPETPAPDGYCRFSEASTCTITSLTN